MLGHVVLDRIRMIRLHSMNRLDGRCRVSTKRGCTNRMMNELRRVELHGRRVDHHGWSRCRRRVRPSESATCGTGVRAGLFPGWKGGLVGNGLEIEVRWMPISLQRETNMRILRGEVVPLIPVRLA